MITKLSGTVLSINVLPNDVLLEIFDHYVNLPQRSLFRDRRVDAWNKLVHMCQRWRYVVFDSPRRLDLRLLCTNRTPVTNMLDIWPVLLIIISARLPLALPASGVTNIISALQQHNCVYTIDINGVPNSLLKEFAAMQEPFLALTQLWLWSFADNALVLPDSFLGGSVPRLQELYLIGIPFPALLKLLLSTHDLVTLCLESIPCSRYFSPKVIVTALSTLTSLESLDLLFWSPPSQTDRASRRLPPLTRIILSTLTKFCFHGDSEYLEDIVS
jgi:hypothetical protein